MNLTNNLFYYATSELSQDAFICWLLSHALKENWENDKNITRCAVEFLENILKSQNINMSITKENTVTEIKQQYKRIDVLVRIENLHIIIEDKTFTNTREKQLENYKNALKKDGIEEKNILCVLYKIEDQIEEKGVDYEYTREKLLNLFKKFDEIKNEIFINYCNYLKSIEDEANNFRDKEINISEWTKQTYIGFFKYLKKELKYENLGWGYVSNPSGGFMGMWIFPLNNEKSKEYGFSENETLYAQIENNEICIKYFHSVDEKLDKEEEISYIQKKQEKRKKLYEYFNKKFENEFNKKNFRYGKHMTVGYVKYDNYEDGRKKLDKILQEINNCEFGEEIRNI